MCETQVCVDVIINNKGIKLMVTLEGGQVLSKGYGVGIDHVQRLMAQKR
ncbi:MAG: hypothetical protein ACJAS3_000378 [Roseivirga sp.]|jgi:hypothetical protein